MLHSQGLLLYVNGGSFIVAADATIEALQKLDKEHLWAQLLADSCQSSWPGAAEALPDYLQSCLAQLASQQWLAFDTCVYIAARLLGPEAAALVTLNLLSHKFAKEAG